MERSHSPEIVIVGERKTDPDVVYLGTRRVSQIRRGRRMALANGRAVMEQETPEVVVQQPVEAVQEVNGMNADPDVEYLGTRQVTRSPSRISWERRWDPNTGRIVVELQSNEEKPPIIVIDEPIEEKVEEKVEEEEEEEVEEFEGPRYPTEATLEKFFAIPTISKLLFKYTGPIERQSLKAVSHFFEDLLEHQPLQIDEFRLTLNEGRKLYIDGVTLAEDKIGEKSGYRIGNRIVNRKRKGSFIKFFNKTVSYISKHQNASIKKLIVDGAPAHQFEFDFNLRMKVSEFHASSVSSHDIRHFMTVIHPRHIREIWLDEDKKDYRVRAEDPSIFCNYKLQWKKAKTCICKTGFQTPGFVQNFAHFDYCHFVVNQERISFEGLQSLKDALLRRPTLQKFEIIPSPHHPPSDHLFILPVEAFRAFNRTHHPYNYPYPNRYVFPYPDSDQKLTLEISYDGIVFKGPCYSGDMDVKPVEKRPREEMTRVIAEMQMNAAVRDLEPPVIN